MTRLRTHCLLLASALAVPLTLGVGACELSGCAAGSNVGPTLQSVVARVDVPRLLECAQAGDAKAAAKCLGARALTEGLRLAMEEATRLAEDAQLASAKGAGAADMSEPERAALAMQLDHSLDRLADEIAATHE